jgi:hypothetical protein
VKPNECQVHSLQPMHVPLSRLQVALQMPARVTHMLRRRLMLASNILRRLGTSAQEVTSAQDAETQMQAGDRVRVKSRDEILQTLDNWNELAGCGFMDEMWEFCDTEQVVLKRVERFLDERDYRIKRVKRVYLLEDRLCTGTIDFGRCDRSCFYFWREEWLDRT